MIKFINMVKQKKGLQRYRCQGCQQCFQHEYHYEAHKPSIPKKIIDRAINVSGVRDTSRVLGISATTVIAHLKKLTPSTVNPVVKQLTKKGKPLTIQLFCEMDQQWSFVKSKKNQRWLWYAWSPQLKQILAYHLGSRTHKSAQQLLSRLKDLPIAVYCTDNFSAYRRLLPSSKHLIGKRYTQRIERNNLNFRTHIKRLTRKTICFSTS